MPTYRQIGKPLKINDLSAKTPETTGNKPAKFKLLKPYLLRDEQAIIASISYHIPH
jgi:hypothetical protein